MSPTGDPSNDGYDIISLAKVEIMPLHLLKLFIQKLRYNSLSKQADGFFASIQRAKHIGKPTVFPIVISR